MSNQPRIDQMFGEVKSDSFLGLPQLHDLKALSARVAILGAPNITPYKSIGAYCAHAPTAIRAAIAPYAANLYHIDFDLGRPLLSDVSAVIDCGDLPYHEEDFAKNRTDLREAIATILDKNAKPIVIGGDDSVPIPIFEAFSGRGEYTILQIDAHIDWRDEVDGERYGLSSNMRRASEMPHIVKMIQVGQRAIGSARQNDYEDACLWGVNFLSAKKIATDGVESAIRLIEPDSKVIVALDIDGLDPSIVPGVIGRAPGGLSYWQMIELLQGVHEKANLAAFSLVEFMPERDLDDLGALVAGRIIANAMALMAEGE